MAVTPTLGDPLASLSDERLHRLFAYLEAKRGTREFAARRDINPFEFSYVLGHVALLDVVYEPLRFRYRLVGTILAATTGYDLTGSFVDEHPDVEYRAFVTARYAETVAWRRATSGVYDLSMDRKRRHYEWLRVPLSSDGQTVDMIIAAFISDVPVPSPR